MSAITIQTERLILRALNENDCSNIRYLLKPEIESFSGPYMPHNEEQLKQHIDRIKGNTSWGILLKDNTFIGDIGVYSKVDNKIGEMAWYLDPVFCNNGYATEACKAVINYIFNELLFVRLSAQIDINNISSRKLAERLNFELNAILPQANLGGKINDIAYYSLPNNFAK